MSFRPLRICGLAQIATAVCEVLALATLSGGCSDGVSVSTRGTILAADGTPTLLGVGTTATEMLITSDAMATGAVTTNATSALSLALTPGTLVELRPTSEMKILALSMRKDGDETAYDSMRRRDAHIELKQGALVGSQERPDVEAEPLLTVDTPEGKLVSSFDSTFLIKRDEHGTRVVCASGLLYFQPKGQPDPVELEGGSFGEWSASSGRVAAAESDAAAQVELSEVLDVVSKLRALRDGQRNKLPIVRGR